MVLRLYLFILIATFTIFGPISCEQSGPSTKPSPPANATKEKVSQSLSHYLDEDLRLNPEQIAYLENGLHLSGAAYPVKLWPKGVVPYTFAPGFPVLGKNTFVAAATEINKNVGLHLRPAVSGDKNILRAHHKTPWGCSSLLGMNISKEFKGHVVSLNGAWCHGNKYVVMHELYHALGMGHEHSRHDRDQYIKFYPNRPFRTTTDAHQTRRFPTAPRDEMPAFDITSIMHYPSCKGQAGCNAKTAEMVTIDDKLIYGYNLGIYPNSDILGMLQLYAKELGLTPIVGFKKAYLDIMQKPKLDSKDHLNIINFIKKNRDIRDLRWSLSQAAAPQAKIKSLNKAVFGNLAIPKGVNQMVIILTNGGSIAKLKTLFVSGVFVGEEIMSIYQHVLSRMPTNTETKAIRVSLNGGQNLKKIKDQLVAGSLFKTRVSAVYKDLFNIDLDQAKLAEYRTRVSGSESLGQLIQEFLTDPKLRKSIDEFATRTTEDSEKSRLSALEAIMNELKNGATKEQAKSKYLNSKEMIDQIQSVHQKYLGMKAQAEFVASWTKNLNDENTKFEDLKQGFMLSDEVLKGFIKTHADARGEEFHLAIFRRLVKEKFVDISHGIQGYRQILIEENATKIKLQDAFSELNGKDLGETRMSALKEQLKKGENFSKLIFIED